MVDGPALYSPRVHAQSGSAGRYEFRVLLAEPGEYRVMIRLDFASDLGMCTCDAQHSVIRFQHLLSSRVEALSPPDLSAGYPFQLPASRSLSVHSDQLAGQLASLEQQLPLELVCVCR